MLDLIQISMQRHRRTIQEQNPILNIHLQFSDPSKVLKTISRKRTVWVSLFQGNPVPSRLFRRAINKGRMELKHPDTGNPAEINFPSRWDMEDRPFESRSILRVTGYRFPGRGKGWTRGYGILGSVFCAGRETINRQAGSGALVSGPGYQVYTTHGPLRINVAFHGELITTNQASLSPLSPSLSLSLSFSSSLFHLRREALEKRKEPDGADSQPGTRVPNRFNGTTVTRSLSGAQALPSPN